MNEIDYLRYSFLALYDDPVLQEEFEKRLSVGAMIDAVLVLINSHNSHYRFSITSHSASISYPIETNGQTDGVTYVEADGTTPATALMNAWMNIQTGNHEEPRVDDLKYRLTMAQVGSCSCGTKTPVESHHDPYCIYRLLREANSLI